MSIDFVSEPSIHGAPSRVRARITDFATLIPSETILQSDAARAAQGLGVSKRWNRMLPALYRKSGVLRRSSVLLGPPNEDVFARQSFYGIASETEPLGPSTAARMQAYQQHAGPLLQRAAQRVIDRTQQGTDSITHLVTVSCTGFCAPGIDYHLIESLGLKSTVERTHVGFMGCHGLINGMRVATALVQSNPQARVLVGAVELCSLHQQYSEDSDQLVASALFSDGAACMLVESDRCDEPSSSGGWEILSSLSRRLDHTSDLMAWYIGNHGFQMTLSPRIPSVIESHLHDPIAEWLAAEQLALSDINSWAVHPGGPRVIDAAGRALGLDESMLQSSRDILWEYGNMSSPTVLFILERLHPSSSSGDYVVMLAFGPGLQVEALLLRRV